MIQDRAVVLLSFSMKNCVSLDEGTALVEVDPVW